MHPSRDRLESLHGLGQRGMTAVHPRVSLMHLLVMYTGCNSVIFLLRPDIVWKENSDP